MNNLNQHDHIMRQLDILPPDKLGEKITIIGAGAVGSFTALALAKMGFSDITVYDFDEVSRINMSCQFYRLKDIGKPKVLALRELVYDFTEVKINAVQQKYEQGYFSGIVIAAVDSMAVRKNLWEEQLKGFRTKYFIDPRMGAEFAMVYTTNPLDEERVRNYQGTLYTDAAAQREKCTAKATTYTAMMLAGEVCKIVKDIVTDGKIPHTIQWSIKDDDLLAYTA